MRNGHTAHSIGSSRFIELGTLRALVLGLGLLSRGYAADGMATFEAASVKSADHIQVPTCMVGPGVLEYRCWGTLPDLVASALSLGIYAIPHGKAPAYYVDAKLPKGSTQEQVDQMLLNLLVQRFGLEYHFDRKDMDGYFLTVDSGNKGPVPVAGPVAEVAPQGFFVGNSDRDIPPVLPGHFSLRRSPDGGDCWLVGKAVTMKMLANHLSFTYNIVVVDDTARDTRYDFRLTYRNPDSNDGVSQSPDMWTVLRKELGLKVTHKTGLIKFLVIDKAASVPTNY